MNKQAFLTSLGVEVHVLEFWIAQEWLVPDRADTDMIFTEIDAARARLIQDLKGGFGVNDEGVDVILHLLDQLHGFRRAFAELQQGLPPSSGGAAD